MHRAVLVLTLFASAAVAQQSLPATLQPNGVELNRDTLAPFMGPGCRLQQFYELSEVGQPTGTLTIRAVSMRFDGPSGLIVGGVIAAFLLAIYLTHKIKDILALPGKIRAKDAAAKRERGVAALTRGLEIHVE